MNNLQAKTNNNTQQNTKLTSDCISPEELVKKHLQDQNHQISDEELANVAVDCHETSASFSTEISDKDDNSDTTEKPIAPTPLDIIAS